MLLALSRTEPPWDAVVALRRPGLRAADMLSLPAYRLFRQAHQRWLIAHRAARTLVLGPCMRLQFEDALTVSYQVHEVLRAERIADDQGVQCEIDTYAHLLPDGTNWKATLLIELPDATERERLLPLLSRSAHSVYIDVAGQRAPAFANEDLGGSRNARHLERPSGVHFLRFGLSPAMRDALRAGADATLGCADENYPWAQAMPPSVLKQLCGDLAPTDGAVPMCEPSRIFPAPPLARLEWNAA